MFPLIVLLLMLSHTKEFARDQLLQKKLILFARVNYLSKEIRSLSESSDLQIYDNLVKNQK